MKQTQTTDVAVEFKGLEQFQTLNDQELMDVIGGDGRGTLKKNGFFGRKR